MKTKLIILFIAISILVKGQYTILHNFNGAQGANPYGNLTLVGNKLYGMTYNGGAHDSGCIFSIDTNGNSYRDLFDFNDSSGFNPLGSLLFSRNRLYGMTTTGGTVLSDGTLFSVDTDGSEYKVVLNFNNANGEDPVNSLILSGNKLYGMTPAGGMGNFGNIFFIDTNGTRYKDVYNFNQNGYQPYSSLTLSGGKLFGTTFVGTNNLGCIFSIDTDGNNYKVLLNFNDTNGADPYNSLTLSGNKLYGMTIEGGTHDSGRMFSIDTDGTEYKDIFDFSHLTGYFPQSSLTLSGSTLCGMTSKGGTDDYGVVFSIDTSGGNSYKELYDFDGKNGAYLYGSITISGSVLYGMTSEGGTYNRGVVFKLTEVGLGINEIKANQESINVYPNPSNGAFTLSCHSEQSEESNSMIEVYNVLGEQVFTGTLRSAQGDNTINLSAQPNGLYLYRVIAESGELVGEGKLIIQK